jgi:hypothetical protein
MAMGEFTARIKITPTVLDFLKTHSVSQKILPPLAESFWKPRGVNLRAFPPAKKSIRLRSVVGSLEPASVDEIETPLARAGYIENKVNLFSGSLAESENFLRQKGYEKWAQYIKGAVEYILKLPTGVIVNILEELADGKPFFVKLEAESEKDIEEIIAAMGLTKNDLIFKNRAELIAEQMGLI